MRQAARFAVITAVWLVWAVAGFQVASGGAAATAILPASSDASSVRHHGDLDS